MAYDENVFPITAVVSAGTTYAVPADIPCPSSYNWKLSDVSASDAGRTEDTKMQKKRLTQKRHLELEWTNITRGEASAIMQAFNAEYFDVTFWDLLDNDYMTLRFYAGDRESPMYNMALGIQSSVRFNIIEQ